MEKESDFQISFNLNVSQKNDQQLTSSISKTELNNYKILLHASQNASGKNVFVQIRAKVPGEIVAHCKYPKKLHYTT